MKGWLLTSEDFRLDKTPGMGDMVMYYDYNMGTRKRQAKAGIIAREQDTSTWIVNQLPVDKHRILFVLTTDAYLRFKAWSNPLAV